MEKNSSQDSIFLRRKKPVDKGLNVALLLSRTPVSGDVGLEIEVEGFNLPKHDGWYIERDANKKPLPSTVQVRFPKSWRYVADHSLRGEDNAEYVLKEPVKFDEVPAVLDELWGMFRQAHSRLDISNRTSVHVHVNVQNFHMNRLTSFMTMYYVVEDILTQWCGEHRVGNLFCLSAKDAPGILEQVKDFIISNGGIHPSDNLHYAGLSFYAVKKFGSLEFRTLRGVTSPDVINDWVRIIRRMYEMSANYTDPRELVHLFSGVGPLEWFEIILGKEVLNILRRDIPHLSDDYIRTKMYENIRIAQDLCFCRDWDSYEPVELKPDPFGRSIKKVMQLMNDDSEQSTIMPVSSPASAFQTIYQQLNTVSGAGHFWTNPMMASSTPDFSSFQDADVDQPAPMSPEPVEIYDDIFPEPEFDDE